MSKENEHNLSRRRLIAAGLGTAAATLLPKLAEATPAAPAADPVRQYRIHPAIGVARVGNADPSTYFIGPEIPGVSPLIDPVSGQRVPRKVNGLVKPQAARFRLWEYQKDANGQWQPIAEANLGTAGIVGIEWHVHLANKKAAFNQFGGPAGESTPALGLRNATVADRNSLVVDFGERIITGSSQGPVQFQVSNPATDRYPKKPDGTAVINYLGQLRTDSSGRLLVLGGAGVAGYNTATMPALSTYANNDNWFDDISDGPVKATIQVQNSSGGIDVVEAVGAWVLVAPPDFAPEVSNAVTMYDLLYDVAVRSIPIPADNGLYNTGQPLNRLKVLKSAYRVSTTVELPGVIPYFDTEIKPILQAGYNYYFVDSLVPSRHNSLVDPALGDPNPAKNTLRQTILGYMRPPNGVTGPKAGKKSMPATLGDDPYSSKVPAATKYLALTHTQYALMTNWAAGNFVATDPNPWNSITPWGLDRAALENCVGGAFFPGIEASWQIRSANLYSEPFRLNPQATSQYYGESGVPVGPGHFSRQMAVPWHADFNDCRNEGSNSWWPGQRPTTVYVQATATRIDWARPDGKFAAGGTSTSSHLDMVNCWYKFGFVVASGAQFVESERNANIQ